MPTTLPTPEDSSVHLPAVAIERELRFVLPQESIRGRALQKTEYDYIAQHYFPRALVPSIASRLLRALNIPESESALFSSARIRRLENSRGSCFVLCAKGPKFKNGEDPVAQRHELEMVCPAELAPSLLRQAVAGSLVKVRHTLPGWVQGARGEKTHLDLSVDLIVGTGLGVGEAQHLLESCRAQPLPERLELVLADLEVPNQQIARAVLARNHSWGILERAQPLIGLEKEVTRHFSARRLAKRGYTPALHSTLLSLRVSE